MGNVFAGSFASLNDSNYADFIFRKKRLKENYGEWAVVTGASSGIGYELATRLAESGLSLVICARNKSGLDKIAAEFSQQYKVTVKVIAADVGQSEGVQAIIDAAKDLPVGLLVASAGFGTSGLFQDADIAEEVKMLRVNCEGLLVLTHFFSRQFVHRKKGGIILLSSMVGFQGVPYAAHYAATKAYVQSLGEALAVELRPYGVDVLAAAPGPVQSGFGDRSNMAMSMSMIPGQIGMPILKALGRKGTVLPGFLTKLLVGALRTVPRWAKIRIMQSVMGGMTAHQRGAN